MKAKEEVILDLSIAEIVSLTDEGILNEDTARKVLNQFSKESFISYCLDVDQPDEDIDDDDVEDEPVKEDKGDKPVKEKDSDVTEDDDDDEEGFDL